MRVDDHALPPAGGGWNPLTEPSFETLGGPMFLTREGLEPEEPIRIGFRVTPAHLNPNGACHGGMMATFIDMALGMSLRAATKAWGPTMSLSVDFLSAAAAGDWIESRSRFVHATYKTGYCDVVALGPNGPVARGNGIFRIVRPKDG